MTEEEAIERIAHRIQKSVERLDPTGEVWVEMPDDAKEFWRCVADDLVAFEGDTIETALRLKRTAEAENTRKKQPA